MSTRSVPPRFIALALGRVDWMTTDGGGHWTFCAPASGTDARPASATGIHPSHRLRRDRRAPPEGRDNEQARRDAETIAITSCFSYAPLAGAARVRGAVGVDTVASEPSARR
jgi:hypothetical protein